AILDAPFVAIGSNTLRLSVADKVGNVGEAAVAFTVSGGTVTVHVTRTGGLPAAGVDVRLDSPASAPVVTDAQGDAVFGGQRPGQRVALAAEPISGLTVSNARTLPDGEQVTIPLQLPAFGRIA